MTSNILIKDLSKRFDDAETLALSDITIEIPTGKITGLVGPDGAGKTTLMRTIIGLLTPTSGSISTMGFDTIKERRLINENIGYMSQKTGVYDDLSIEENMVLFAKLKGVPEETFEETFNKLLTFTDLKDFRDRLAGKLSGGMRQKLGLACALLGRPRLLLLDEPSVGVDPISRRELIKIVKQLQSDGMTIVWSTAYLEEAENFDNCILMNEGKVLFHGNPYELTKTVANHVFLTKSDTNNRQLLKEIKANWDGVMDATIRSDHIKVVFKDEIQSPNKNLKPTEPAFEDAVIYALGGCPQGESKLTQNFEPITNGSKNHIIEADNLVKKYGDFYAVKNNTFSVKKGEIFGLLGPNGAGKSTTFKMLCGLITPTAGTTRIMGIDIQKNPTKARSYLGYMAQKFSLYGSLTVKQNLDFFAGIYGLIGKKKKEKVSEMIDIFKFKNFLEQNAEELPLGYKQRLALSCATMHSPSVLFLDEPTSGVDPITRRDFWNHINALADKGVTVLVTTHFMNEAEFCDRISLFYRGETIAMGSPIELKSQVGPHATMEETFVSLINKFDKKGEQ